MSELKWLVGMVLILSVLALPSMMGGMVGWLWSERDALPAQRWHQRLLRTARRCALLPMVAGTLIFLAWWLRRGDDLMLLGGLTAWLGQGVLVAGGVLLARCWQRLDEAARRQARLTLLLLALNLPLALGLGFAVKELNTRAAVEAAGGGVMAGQEECGSELA